MKPDRTLAYRPEIDGLRAVAVIPVLLFHAGFGCPGGYVGVDVFFVISGFLIGSLIIREIEAGSFRFTRFWVRRIRRLFPALAVTLAATAAIGFLLLIPAHTKSLGSALVAQPLFAANFLFWSQSGYFETASEYQPLLHTWSLAVEEQFYLVLPLLLVPLCRKGRGTVVVAIWLLMAVSFVWSLYATARHPSASFYLLPSRFWELNLGVALALFTGRGLRTRGSREMASIAGLAAILLPVFLYSRTTPFPGMAALAPCIGTALLIFANTGKLSASGRVLASPLPVWIGKISYPLYLWHWPCLLFARYRWFAEDPRLVAGLALLVSFVLAWLTYRWIECPVRERRVLGRPANLVGSAAIFVAIIAAVGVVFDSRDGFSREETRPGRVAEDHWVNAVKGIYSMRKWMKEGGDPFIAGDVEGPGGNILLWGDSHSLSLIPVLDDLGKETEVAVFAACEPANAPLFGARTALIAAKNVDYEPMVRGLLETHEFHTALLVGRWPAYLEKKAGGPGEGYLVSEQGGPFDSAEASRQHYISKLSDTIRFLESRGIKVVIVRAVSYQPHSVPETLSQAESRGLDLNSFALPLQEHIETDAVTNQLLDEAAEGTGAVILDPRHFFTDDRGRYRMAKDGQALYRDRSHLTPFGSRELRSLFEPVFRDVVEAQSKDP